MTDKIDTWSYSKLKVFEQCPYRAYLQFVEKCPQESSEALERGIQVHQEAEDYVRGEGPLTGSIANYKDMLEELKDRYALGKVILEEDWGVKNDWTPCDWHDPELWGRLKLDAVELQDGDRIRIIDYKTGKKVGNEIGHQQQGMTYVIATAYRYPEVKEITCEFWYLDISPRYGVSSRVYKPDQIKLHKVKLEGRLRNMTETTEFIPKPNKFNCKWCPYKPGKGGQCSYGNPE